MVVSACFASSQVVSRLRVHIFKGQNKYTASAAFARKTELFVSHQLVQQGPGDGQRAFSGAQMNVYFVCAVIIAAAAFKCSAVCGISQGKKNVDDF